jgi:hypothetical protein
VKENGMCSNDLRNHLLGSQGVRMLLFLLWAASFSHLPPGLAEQLLAKGMLTAFSDEAGNPLAVVRADRVILDHERVGFFRIGVLPMIVIKGAEIEILLLERLAPQMQQIHLHFSQNGARAVEFRKAAFRFPQDKSPRLSAKCIRSTSDGVWNLHSGVVVDSGRLFEFEEANLQVTGPRPGILTIKFRGTTKDIDLLRPGREQSGQAEEHRKSQ